MKALVAGGGIGGLTTALALNSRGIDCEVYEQAPEIHELGVGINILPPAVRELHDLGLFEALDDAAIQTGELIYQTRRGQEVWREPRGRAAGHSEPQFSIHRGILQSVLLAAVLDRCGPARVHTGHRLVDFDQDADGVTARFVDGEGRSVATDRGDLLIGADGIHSRVRAILYPNEGPPLWNGVMLWRGARPWPRFLTGRSMIIAGDLDAKLVVYPIGIGPEAGQALTNWQVLAKLGEGGSAPPRPQDWSRAGRLDELLPYVESVAIAGVDVVELIRATKEIWEYPMCDRDPLPTWSAERVTLLGDAAHPMYPIGSNGASQAILDARALADALAAAGSDRVADSARVYEGKRLPMTAEIVRSNRKGGPEAVIDTVERLAPDGFSDIDAVLPYADRAAIVEAYAERTGLTVRRDEDQVSVGADP